VPVGSVSASRDVMAPEGDVMDPEVGPALSRARRLCPEAEVLLLSARSRLDDADAERLYELLRTPLDWAYLLRIAQANGVSALLYWRLHTLAPAPVPVPEPLLAQLRSHFMLNAARNLLAQRELLRIIGLLEGQGIPVVSFKGPVLAAAAYANRALREYIDLDVLVRRGDVRRALQLLQAAGYRRALPLRGLGRAAYHQSECAIDLVSADGSVMLEVHWDLMPHYFSLPFDLPRLWQDLEQAQLDGTPIRSLAITDLVLFLCLHGTKHRWEQLRWLCDLAEISQTRPDLDWDRLLRLAQGMGSERMLLLGLWLAADLLRAAVPPALLRRASDDATILSLAESVTRQLFSESEELFAARNLFYLRAMQSPWQRLRYCLHVALVPTKHELHQRTLPPALSPLYYPLHLANVLGQAGEEITERVLGLAARVQGRSRPARPRTAHAHHH
jgi:hypothetical protein